MHRKHKVHFKIDFNGLTQLCRNFWAEGEYARALAIMTDSGIPHETACNVIRGKLRMTQDPDGIAGVDGMIADDIWQPNLAGCFLGRYPDPNDHKYFGLIERYGKYVMGDAFCGWISTLYRELELSTHYLDKLKIIEQLKTVPDAVREFFGYPEPMYVPTKDLRMQGLNSLGYDPEEYALRTKDIFNLRDRSRNDVEAGSRTEMLGGVLPDAEAFARRRRELYETPKPAPDATFSKPLGWILPTGKFYSCEWMEHDWLASVIGNSPNFDGNIAHNMGWVKITHPVNELRNFQIIGGDKELTQKQLDALFDWMRIYGEFPIRGVSGIITTL